MSSADPPSDRGDFKAAGQVPASDLIARWYEELRLIARAQFRHERAGHTLQPTAIVHEAFLRLVSQRDVATMSRAQLLALGAEMMRRLLVDYARQRKTRRRGGAADRVMVDDLSSLTVSRHNAVDVLLIDDLLSTLGKLSPRQARIVELRFFGGMTVEETAETLNISTRTVESDWKMARAWIRREWSQRE